MSDPFKSGRPPAGPVKGEQRPPLFDGGAKKALLGIAGIALLGAVAFIAIPRLSFGESQEEKLKRVAASTCAELDDALVLQVDSIISRAASEVARFDATRTQLLSAMKAKCPLTMAAIDQIQSDAKDRADAAAARDNLPRRIHVEVEACSASAARGTVRNNSDLSANVFIDVDFLDDKGVILGNSLANVNGLRPGESGRWSAPFIDRGWPDQCRARVGSAFPID